MQAAAAAQCSTALLRHGLVCWRAGAAESHAEREESARGDCAHSAALLRRAWAAWSARVQHKQRMLLGTLIAGNHHRTVLSRKAVHSLLAWPRAVKELRQRYMATLAHSVFAAWRGCTAAAGHLHRVGARAGELRARIERRQMLGVLREWSAHAERRARLVEIAHAARVRACVRTLRSAFAWWRQLALRLKVLSARASAFACRWERRRNATLLAAWAGVAASKAVRRRRQAHALKLHARWRLTKHLTAWRRCEIKHTRILENGA